MADTVTTDDILLREDRGPITILTLNEPSRMNPFSDDMRNRLLALLDAVMAEAAVRVLVLTGAGGHFSAGADVRQMKGAGGADPLRSRRRLGVLQNIVRHVATGPKPVIAAVEGVAFGAGLSVTAACDWVVAAEGARFGAAFGKIGLAPDCGLLWSLPQRIGISRTRDMIFTGQPMDAAGALAAGLADHLAPQGEALSAALGKAEAYLATAPLSIAATKVALAALPGGLEEALALELHQQPLLSSTADHFEARSAFLEKRKPVFQGK